METEKIIQVKGLSISYGNKRVLTNIYLDVFKGHIYGVIGPNGAGKSTLFKSMLGLIELNAGAIEFPNMDPKEIVKKTAYIPQKDAVDWTFPATVMDITLMGRYPHKKMFERITKKDKDIALVALDELGIVDLADRQIGQLSGGQQQRVFIARALAQQSEILFMDEPFVGVDITTEEKIIATMKKLAAEGKTLLVVHHDLSSVEEYFSRVILLNQRLITYGDTKSTFTQENIKKCYGPQLTMLQDIRLH